MKVDFAWQSPNLRTIGWDDLVVGWERTWELPITFEAVGWYADLAEDPNPWFLLFGSPWDRRWRRRSSCRAFASASPIRSGG